MALMYTFLLIHLLITLNYSHVIIHCYLYGSYIQVR